jgi:hypothetical protein
MKDFNIAKYLKENHLGSHAILGNYVDLHALKEEEEMELDTEIPYEGPERKVDGFGDKFKQTNAVEEADGPPFGMPDKSEDNPWMDEVDGTDAYQFGNWTCYYDYPGVLAWSYKDVPLNKLAVYATPNFDGDDTTPIQIDVDGDNDDMMALNQGIFANFNEYAKAMKPYLDRIENLESNWGSLAPSNDSMDTDDSVNPFPSIMKEKEDSVIFDKGWQYDDDEDEVSNDDRFADLGGDQIKSAIKSLMDDGFDTREIAQFVVDTIRGFKSFKEEVTVSSSGVQMEGEEFKWTARDQQGKLHGILYVKPMGDTLMVTADDGMQGTKYTKADIADAMGRGEFIRFRGKDLALDTRMKAWAKPEVVSESSSMTLSNYYRNAEPRVLNTANALDRLLKTSLKDKNKAGEFVDLAIMLADAWAEQKTELSLGRNWQYDKK